MSQTVLARMFGYALVRDLQNGAIALVPDHGGEAEGFPGGISFHTNLSADHFRGSDLVRTYDFGSGAVTNVGVLALANDWNLAGPSGAPINTLKLAKFHISGTGSTAAAATDIKIQTISANGGQTPVTGTQVLVSAANVQKYQTVATIAYTGTESVNEWALLTEGTVSATTGTPFTAGATATTAPVTGTPLTASSSTVQGSQQHIFENTASATPHWGLVLSNSTSVITVPAWYKVSDGTAAGTTPANGEAYLIRPVMWDRKVFVTPIGVVNGDSIQFTYTLTITAGG